MSAYLPHGLKLLEQLGFRFEVDWDGEIAISSSRWSADEMVDILTARFEKAIANELEIRRRNNLQVCVGGPYHGKRHSLFRYANKVECFHEGPKRWAVYQFGPPADGCQVTPQDGRLFFRGWATSKAKGRRLQLQPKEAGS